MALLDLPQNQLPLELTVTAFVEEHVPTTSIVLHSAGNMLSFACLDGEFTSTNKTSSSTNLGNPFQSQGLVRILIMRFQTELRLP